jgi:TusA-related sulfurtransferase
MAKKIHVDKVLNLSGLQTPQSIFLITKTLEKVKQGGLLEIVSREKAIIRDIPTLFDGTSCKIIEIKEKHGLVHYTIIKN